MKPECPTEAANAEMWRISFRISANTPRREAYFIG